MEFTWDETKRERVLAEHKVDFAKVGDVFDDVFAVYIEDFKHSTDDEIRFNIIGQTLNYGLIFVAFIYDASDDIRFITARKAEGWMVREYEENRKRL
jgi:uncharacterized DUF497 family protein